MPVVAGVVLGTYPIQLRGGKRGERRVTFSDMKGVMQRGDVRTALGLPSEGSSGRFTTLRIALHMAALDGDSEAAQVLREEGVDPLSTDDLGVPLGVDQAVLLSEENRVLVEVILNSAKISRGVNRWGAVASLAVHHIENLPQAFEKGIRIAYPNAKQAERIVTVGGEGLLDLGIEYFYVREVAVPPHDLDYIGYGVSAQTVTYSRQIAIWHVRENKVAFQKMNTLVKPNVGVVLVPA